MEEKVNSELETFRKEWQQEVTARSKSSSSNQGNKVARPPGQPKPKHGISAVKLKTSTHSGPFIIDEAHGTPETQGYQDLEDKDEARKLGGRQDNYPSTCASRDSSSALEHYEQAVERESQGSLGDSLKLYRKAYKVWNLRPHFNLNAAYANAKLSLTPE